MERKEGSTSYLDEYAIIKHLGAGYQAQSLFPYLESNSEQTSTANS